ncbi:MULTISPECIES: DUF6054 family protein [unclassified Mycobacterium]|uniref:DUF6054 family protein n=1 Tax=unclassified Mycobacterium TaxID=2642494 RepID=UPI0029C654E4|nr:MULTISPECIES: DUF6054 family protein [unclassified Mycobacterium]
MAQHECKIRGDADALVAHLDAQVIRGSVTANLEERSDQRIGDARMLVRTYERYSALGGNRLSLNVAVLAVGTELAISAMTAGGSQAMFWKVNTFGEEAFLAKAVEALESFS